MTAWNEIMAGTSGMAGGPYTKHVQERLSDLLGASAIRLTTSCTDALEMSAILAGLGPGDVVIVPSFGFVTTALAFVRTGASVRFVDIEPEYLGVDPDHLAGLMDDSVKAVVPIHYAGIPCRIEEITEIVGAYENALLVEDNAHGLFGASRGRPLGTFGAVSCLSFHATKNITCGEGGALVVNDPALIDRADIILEKGTDRRQFLKGIVDKYTWRDLGSSFGMSDYLAAILADQLERADEIQTARRAAHDRYVELLEPHQDDLGYKLPVVPPDATAAYHLFYVVLDEASIRADLLKLLNEEGVAASFHFPPLHQSPGGRRWGDGSTRDCAVSERISSSIVRLPLDHVIAARDVERIAERFLGTLERLQTTI